MSRKGSTFEIGTAKQLSLWWTGGMRDDVFWRSQNSGARATVRGKKKQQTAGQYGDIAAADPIGHALTSRITLELKRGYSGACPFDALDSATTATQDFTAFIRQAVIAAANAETPGWAVIARRDRRVATITIPFRLLCSIVAGCRRAGIDTPGTHQILCGEWFSLTSYVGKPRGLKSAIHIVTAKLDDFLIAVTPDMIKAIEL